MFYHITFCAVPVQTNEKKWVLCDHVFPRQHDDDEDDDDDDDDDETMDSLLDIVDPLSTF